MEYVVYPSFLTLVAAIVVGRILTDVIMGSVIYIARRRAIKAQEAAMKKVMDMMERMPQQEKVDEDYLLGAAAASSRNLIN